MAEAFKPPPLSAHEGPAQGFVPPPPIEDKEETPIGDRPASMASFTEVPRIMGGQAIEGAKGAVKGLARSIYDTGSMALNPFGMNPIANAIDKKRESPKRSIGSRVHRIRRRPSAAIFQMRRCCSLLEA